MIAIFYQNFVKRRLILICEISRQNAKINFRWCFYTSQRESIGHAAVICLKNKHAWWLQREHVFAPNRDLSKNLCYWHNRIIIKISTLLFAHCKAYVFITKYYFEKSNDNIYCCSTTMYKAIFCNRPAYLISINHG